jgi:hypothetical protein
MNKLSALPRGFGAFPVLEVLDLTYNNLNESSLPGNFFMIGIFLNSFWKIKICISNLLLVFKNRNTQSPVLG